MSIALLPCSECHRHVRHDAPRCPFCGAATTSVCPVAPADEGGARGLSRARVVLMAAVTLTASASLAACYGGPPRRPGAYDPTVAAQVEVTSGSSSAVTNTAPAEKP